MTRTQFFYINAFNLGIINMNNKFVSLSCLVLTFIAILFDVISATVTYPYTCKDSERNMMCTAEVVDSIGVCGYNKDKKGYISGNKCSACSKAEILTVEKGRCPISSMTQAPTPAPSTGTTKYPYYCQDSDRKTVCTMEYLVGGLCA